MSDQEHMYQEEQMPDQEHMYQEDYNPYIYEEQVYGMEGLGTIKSADSSSNGYTIRQKPYLLERINQQIKQLGKITSLLENWNIYLLYLNGWDLNHCCQTYDQNSKLLIKYTPGYQLNPIKGQCSVCCEEIQLLNNSCGHRFCINCWKQQLEKHYDRQSANKLFPDCLKGQCYMNYCLDKKCNHKKCTSAMNYHLIQTFCFMYPHIKTRFDHIICMEYARKSHNTRMCPNPKCNKVILVNDFQQRVIRCQCQTEICIFCNENNHQPLDCQDYQNWIKISQDLEGTWIQIVPTKQCPSCKQPIQKNQGCNHMTCRCKFQFCWLCLSDYKKHVSCKPPDQTKLEKESQKRQANNKLYKQRFEMAKAQIDRLKQLMKKAKNIDIDVLREKLTKTFKIYQTQTQFLYSLKETLTKWFNFVLYFKIYTFFQRKFYKDYILQIEQLQQESINKIQNFLQKELLDKLKKVEGNKLSAQQAKEEFEKAKYTFISKERIVIKIIKETTEKLL